MSDETFSSARTLREVADDLESQKRYTLEITAKEAEFLARAQIDLILQNSHSLTLEEDALNGALWSIAHMESPEETST